MRRLLLVSGMVLLATAGLALAASLRPSSFKGVVVARQHGVLLVAGPRGTVRAVGGSARVGTRVTVSGSHVTRVGFARHARVRGVLVARAHGVTFISAARHVLALHSGRRLASAAAASGGAQPGDVVVASVAIGAQGELDDQGEDDVGQASQVTLVATVTGIGAGTITVSVNGQTLTIPLPPGTPVAGIAVGSQIQLTVSFAGGQAQATSAGEDNQSGGDDNSSGDDGSGEDGHHDGTTTASTATTATATTATTTTSEDDGGSQDGSHDGGGHH